MIYLYFFYIIKTMDKKNVLELFGGCGGLGYGFHKEGFNIECCNELEQKIANTYIHNFPD